LGVLWTKADTPADERANFLWNVDSCSGADLEEKLKLYRAEIGRLNDLLPVVEMMRRREFTKQRLLSMKPSGDGSRLKNIPAAKLLKDEKQREETMKELSRLSEQLVPLIMKFENSHREEYLVDGKRYLEQMQHDAPKANSHRVSSAPKR